MTRRAPLDNVAHHDLRVVPRFDADFGAGVNQAALLPTEFEEAQRDFPILFERDEEGRFQAVALLGLDRDENLFLDGDGWRSRHVPAVIQRGPFSIGVPVDAEDGGEPLIHIDLDDPRVGTVEGLPLFLPHGGHAPYLEHVSRLLRAIYAGLEMAGPMYAAFAEFDLIRPVSLEIELSDAERYTIPDHFAVTQEALAALDGAALERLNAQGYLYPAFLAAASLANINRLIELKNRASAA